MKILIVNSTDINGGAARAAYRLHQALLSEGVQSEMLVQNKFSDDYTVLDSCSKFDKAINRYRAVLDSIPLFLYKDKTKTRFSPSWLPFSKIVNKINEIAPDIVHLHWICDGMIKIEDLAKIKAPIIWSLHDNWAFTGGCHIMWECERYMNNCGSCPRLNSKNANDLSRRVFLRKQKTFVKVNNITIVGLSKWIANCASKSSLFANSKIVNIPNPIDTSKFKPIVKKLARQILNLPQNKKLVLYGAMNATIDINKGFKELSNSIQILDCDNVEFVIFGSSKPQNSVSFKYKMNYIGHLNDDISLMILYNACDVTVLPSLQENLSNVIMESLSCSTPVVAFDIGGNSDMIEHEKNGYLVKPYNSSDLAYGIKWILENSSYESICMNARSKILNEFDSVLVVKKYIQLYKNALEF